MKSCNEPDFKVLFYLDQQLSGQELEEFRNHLSTCPDCKAQLEAEQELSRVLGRTRPLYAAPVELRARIEAVFDEHSKTIARDESIFRRALHFFKKQVPDGSPLSFDWGRILVPAAIVVVLCLIAAPNVMRQVRAASYVDAAVATHHTYLDGKLGDQIQSTSPEAVTAWFAGKLPFQFRLPNSSHFEGKPIYHLAGASLVHFQGSPAAFVVYDAPSEKISLLIASAKSAIVAGGDEIHAGSLTFHYLTRANFKVITWTNHDLSYALVSSTAASGRGSCLVCHQEMPDRDKFRD
jgi:mycothiol system anti-sigma-R factor